MRMNKMSPVVVRNFLRLKKYPWQHPLLPPKASGSPFFSSAGKSQGFWFSLTFQLFWRLEVAEKWMQDWGGGWLQRGSWPLAGGPHCFAFPGALARQSSSSVQEQSRATSDTALGWATKPKLELPGVSLLHIQSFLNFLLVTHMFFSFRKLEMSSIASLTGMKTSGEWALKKGQAAYRDAKLKI